MGALVMKGGQPYALPSDVKARRYIEEMQEQHMVQALHRLCTMRTDEDGNPDKAVLYTDDQEYAKNMESLVLMKETHDQVKEESYNRALGFTRKSLTYLEGRATMLDREFSK